MLVFDGSGNLIRRFVHGFQADQILAEEDVTTGVVTWPLTDKLGTVHDRMRYDAATSQAVWHAHYSYDSFGRIVKQVDGATGLDLGTYDAKSYYGAFGPTYGFQGREYEADADLYFHRARWYDYWNGRFVSEDPIFDDTTNTYRYVGNSPTNGRDPSGLEEIGVIAVIVDPTKVPPTFSLPAVQDQMNLALKNAGIDKKILFMPTDATQEEIEKRLGYANNRPRMTSCSIEVGMKANFANPLYWGWIAGEGLLYQWWATEPVSYTHYLRFSDKTGLRQLGQNAAGGYITTIYGKNWETAEDYLGRGSINYDVAYANVILHEMFWHGMLGNHGHGPWWGEAPAPGDFDHTIASPDTLVDLSEWADDIESCLD